MPSRKQVKKSFRELLAKLPKRIKVGRYYFSRYGISPYYIRSFSLKEAKRFTKRNINVYVRVLVRDNRTGRLLWVKQASDVADYKTFFSRIEDYKEQAMIRAIRTITAILKHSDWSILRKYYKYQVWIRYRI